MKKSNTSTQTVYCSESAAFNFKFTFNQAKQDTNAISHGSQLIYGKSHGKSF